MPPDDDDGQQQQREHARMFSSGTEEESRPEDRYDPVVVDLNADDGKKGEGRPDTAAAELRAQLAAQRNATQYAQQVAAEAHQRAQIAEQRVMGSTVSAIDSALQAAEQQALNFKAEFQAALDAADHRAAAEAQEKLSDARHNLLRLQEQRAYVDAEARRPLPQQRQQPQPQQIAGVDQIAEGLAQDGYPRSADWLRSHPEWASRPDLLKRVASASNHLVDNRGLALESDEYFMALEQELGMSQRPQRGDYGQAQRRAGPPASAAPTNGSVSLRTGQTGMRSHVPLTAEQRAAAIEMHGMTEKEFAQEFEKARVEGKLIGYR